MTRKRFIKLCMADGYSRNSANLIADKTITKKESYEHVYRMTMQFKRLTDEVLPTLGTMIAPAIESIQKMVQAFGSGLAAFSRAYIEAMNEEKEGDVNAT